MIKTYFKTAWRNLVKNRTTSLINIGGLSIGLAVAIIIMFWVSDEYSYNKFHAHLPNIYSVMQNEKQGGQIYTTQSVPGFSSIHVSRELLSHLFIQSLFSFS